MSTSTAAETGKIQPRLKQKYQAEIKAALQEEFGYANINQVPRIVKIVVNTGVGEAARDSKVIDGAVDDLVKITGQKPIARVSQLVRTLPFVGIVRGSSWIAS